MRINLKTYLDILQCSISQDVLENPITIKTGHTYGQTNIHHWLGIRNTCPNTKEELLASTRWVLPNSDRSILALIQFFARQEAGSDIDLAALLRCLVITGQNRIPLIPVTTPAGDLIEGAGMASTRPTVVIQNIIRQIVTDIVAIQCNEVEMAAIREYGLIPFILLHAIERGDKVLFQFWIKEPIDWNQRINTRTLLPHILMQTLTSSSLKSNQDMILLIFYNNPWFTAGTLRECSDILLAHH